MAVDAGGFAVGTGGPVFLAATFFSLVSFGSFAAAAVVVVVVEVVIVVAATTGRGG